MSDRRRNSVGSCTKHKSKLLGGKNKIKKYKNKQKMQVEMPDLDDNKPLIFLKEARGGGVDKRDE